jgi:hypothetical protein
MEYREWDLGAIKLALWQSFEGEKRDVYTKLIK